MDVIEIVVLTTVIIVVVNCIFILWFMIYEDIFKSIIIGKEPILLPEAVVIFIRNCFSQFSSITRPIFIVSIIFYIIFYIFYLIIIFIIPETGIATLFIPIRELLLKIPPFPDLFKYGVIKLMNDIVFIFGLKGFLFRTLNVYFAFYVFSKDNVRRIFNYLQPELGDKIVEHLPFEEPVTDPNSNSNSNNERDKYELQKQDEPSERKKTIYKKIEADTDICISNNMIKKTPLMTSFERNNADFKNSMIATKCHSASVGKYIRSNN